MKQTSWSAPVYELLLFFFFFSFLYILILLNNFEQPQTQMTTVKRDAGGFTDVSGCFPFKGLISFDGEGLCLKSALKRL